VPDPQVGVKQHRHASEQRPGERAGDDCPGRSDKRGAGSDRKRTRAGHDGLLAEAERDADDCRDDPDDHSRQ
jgi:hypothetical protein